jgi:O-antigen ligase
VFPHNNVLGIGAELGVAAMLLFVMVCLVAAVSLSKFALLRRPEVSTRTRLLVSVALGIFVYQQFRGLLQDTWVFRETYFWLGAGMSVVLASGTGRRRPSS